MKLDLDQEKYDKLIAIASAMSLTLINNTLIEKNSGRNSSWIQ
jgi:hypothetical protein